jgi:hypothetical protein
LNIQFVPAGRSAPLLVTEQQIHAGAVALVSDALQNTSPDPPALLALHDEPRRLVCQLAPTPIITGAQQREVSRMLQVHGVLGSWSDDTMLRLRRDSVMSAVGRANNTAEEYLWVPAVRTRQGQVWWPLSRTEHLVIAGQPQAALSGAVGRLLALPDEARPALLVHDPDGRLQEFDDQLARLPAQADALAAARRIQLEARFTHERGSRTGASQLPLLIVVTPAETAWPDLAPLLAPGSGIQVVLVLGDREPLPVLRAVCHRLPVVEVPDIRFPALPDAFRPASVPVANNGQALAWLPGGQQVWRGLPPLSPAGRSDSPEVA